MTWKTSGCRCGDVPFYFCVFVFVFFERQLTVLLNPEGPYVCMLIDFGCPTPGLLAAERRGQAAAVIVLRLQPRAL